jgi:hypothetical protein
MAKPMAAASWLGQRFSDPWVESKATAVVGVSYDEDRRVVCITEIYDDLLDQGVREAL